MARYAKRVGETAKVIVRMPAAMHVHLKDEALLHKRSLNSEILHLLMAPRRRVYEELRRYYRERLEDAYGEAAAELMLATLPEIDARTDEELYGEIEWLAGSGTYDRV